MTSERTKKLLRIYGIALSCVIIVAGICLMVACVGIYRSGDEPFSREAVAAAFSPISIPVYLCLVMVVGSFILKLLFPAAEKTIPVKQLSVMRNRLLIKADLKNCESELKNGILAQQKRRKNQNRICAAVLIVCAAVFLVYALDSSHFHSSEINASMVSAMWVLMPCLIVSFAACLMTLNLRKNSILQEIELLKQCPKLAAATQIPVKPDHTNKIRNALLIAAIALVIFGFCSGGTADVLTKAVNICTECIGLG